MKKLFFMLLGLASLNVYVANPTYDATRGALQNNPGLCQYDYNSNCGSFGQRQQRQPAKIININVPSEYGVWAFNPKTGIAGGALDMNSREEAERETIKACERGGGNAPYKIEVWRQNGCTAVVQGKLGKKWKLFSVVTELGKAEVKAL